MANSGTNKKRRLKRSKAIKVDEDSSLTEFRQFLADRPSWAPHFRELAEAIAEVAAPEPRKSSSSDDCQACDDLLDMYVSDELEGKAVSQLYPQLWQHLQTCSRCQQAHHLLFDTLRRRGIDQFPVSSATVVSRLPFLKAQSADAPWHVRLQSRLTGAPFRLSFSFNVAYLQNWLASPSPLTVRSEDYSLPSAAHLLLYDVLSVGDQMVTVEVMTRPSPDKPEAVTIQANLMGLAALPEKLMGRLNWAGQIYVAPVDRQGQINFGDISLFELKTALDTQTGPFEIAFEAEPEGRDE